MSEEQFKALMGILEDIRKVQELALLEIMEARQEALGGVETHNTVGDRDGR